MAFCTNCGAKVPDGSRFCTECGAPVPVSAPVPTVQPEEINIPEEPAQPALRPDSADTPDTAYSGAEQSTQQSYTPPTQGSYTPPTQGSYTPPTQGSYTPLTQQSYTPPTQQGYQPTQQGGGYSYNANTANAYVPGTKAKKAKTPKASGAKSGGSKLPFIIGGAVLALILLIVLLIKGCTGAVKDAFDPNLGVYNATTAEMYGMTVSVTDLWENGVSIELKAKDKCVFNIDGEKYNIKWTLDGTDINVKGKGLNCDGTLNQGTLVLEDVLGMGVNITFAKEGGYTDHMVDGPGMINEGTGDNGENGYSALQQQWNGTWYGLFHVIDAEGFDSISSGNNFDAYMVVDVDAEGKGTFDVYLFDEFDGPYVSAECEAKESGLYAVSGSAFDMEMNTYNWMFLPMPDYPDQYCMGDTVSDGDYTLDFTMFMKKWGGSWQAESDGGNLVPPGADEYYAKIANGELPPVGTAPYGYAGGAAAVYESEKAESIGSTEAASSEGTSAPEVSAAPVEGFDSGSFTKGIYDFYDKYSASVSFTLPASGWKIDGSLGTLYLYNVKDPSHLFSGDPRIQFEMKESLDDINFYKDKFENLKEIDPRTVGGLELKGRTYKNVGMEWTEYYGELPNGGWLSLQISGTSIEPGSEGDAILNSVTIK